MDALQVQTKRITFIMHMYSTIALIRFICRCSLGPNKEDILQYVASELGDEWKKLAQYLSLKSVRIQAILRQNNQNPEPKKIRYDMLVTWAKRVPRCLNKVRYCKAKSLKMAVILLLPADYLGFSLFIA